MKILKHGQYYSDNHLHVDLLGQCEKCGCEFETFVDINFDSPKKDAMTFVTDADCTNMTIKPEYIFGERYWVGTSYITESEVKGIRYVTYTLPCPECRQTVELKEKTLKYHDGDDPHDEDDYEEEE